MITPEMREELLQTGEREYDEALHQLERGDLSLALEHLELAEKAYLQLQDQHWLNFIYHEKFRILLQRGQAEQALELVDSITAGYLDTKNQRGLALLHIHTAEILRNQGELFQALSNLRIAEAIITSEQINDLMAYLFSSLGITLMALEEFIPAIQIFTAATRHCSVESSAEEFAWCLQQTGTCYQKIFDYASAERYYTGAYQAYFKAGNNEAGHEVVSTLKKMYQSSSQEQKIAHLNTLGKQRRF